jgi:hypothetical protein
MELSSGLSPQRGTGIAVSPRAVRNVLLLVVVALTVIGTATVLYVYLLADEGYESTYLTRGYYLVFDPRGDLSLHDWFSTVALLACAAISALIALITRARRGPYLLHWIVLSLILLLLSADEAAALHERASDALRNPEGGNPWLEPWVGPAAALIVVYGFVYLRFVLDLPPRVRRVLVSGVVVLIAGAVGFEVLESHLASNVGVAANTLGYALVETAEQFLEMLGVVILVYGLMLHLSAFEEDAGIRIRREPGS